MTEREREIDREHERASERWSERVSECVCILKSARLMKVRVEAIEALLSQNPNGRHHGELRGSYRGHVAVGERVWNTPVGVRRWVSLVGIKTETERRSLAYGEVLMVAPTVLTLHQANSRLAACPSLSKLPGGTVKGPAALEYRVIARRKFTPHREVDASRAQTWMKKMRYTRQEHNANYSSTQAKHI